MINDVLKGLGVAFCMYVAYRAGYKVAELDYDTALNSLNRTTYSEGKQKGSFLKKKLKDKIKKELFD